MRTYFSRAIVVFLGALFLTVTAQAQGNVSASENNEDVSVSDVQNTDGRQGKSNFSKEGRQHPPRHRKKCRPKTGKTLNSTEDENVEQQGRDMKRGRGDGRGAGRGDGQGQEYNNGEVRGDRPEGHGKRGARGSRGSDDGNEAREGSDDGYTAPVGGKRGHADAMDGNFDQDGAMKHKNRFRGQKGPMPPSFEDEDCDDDDMTDDAMPMSENRADKRARGLVEYHRDDYPTMSLSAKKGKAPSAPSASEGGE